MPNASLKVIADSAKASVKDLGLNAHSTAKPLKGRDIKWNKSGIPDRTVSRHTNSFRRSGLKVF